ncbi:hypothetical protein [Paracoccus sp. (in: a-proteobacteria)]|uniref:hypothetical protein n=1 Tax=Paracoccus sp. TaxID=267 RepID=UPI0035AE5125
MGGRYNLKTTENLVKILSFVRDGGGTATKTKIRNWLGLSEDDVWAAIVYGEELKCLRAEGQGYYKFLKDFVIGEEAFYPVVEEAVRSLWAKEGWAQDQYYIENTARKDSKIVGPWTRPDFTLVSHRKYPWTIGWEFDVVTFEVKRPDNCNVLAVFEALSHASTATRAYVVFPIDAEKWSKEYPEQEVRVKDECTRHGIGLILIEDVYNKPRPVHVVKAQKREIDHERCSNFLGSVITEKGRQKISMWK